MTDKATIREGSSVYYSLLWTDPSARARCIDRLALIKALASTLDDVQEPQVAEKKIHWWHEELQRMDNGEARHPTTKLNQDALANTQGAQAACLDILSVASTQRFTPATTDAALDDSITLSFKARLALVSHALSTSADYLDVHTHSNAAAIGLGYYDQLARLPKMVHRGLPVFSDEMYRQFNLQPQDMASRIRIERQNNNENDVHDSNLSGIPVTVEKPSVQPLLTHSVNVAKDALSQAINNAEAIERYRKPELMPIWRLLVLRERQLILWQRKRPDLLREHLTLTPLVKLYHAWQNRR